MRIAAPPFRGWLGGCLGGLTALLAAVPLALAAPPASVTSPATVTPSAFAPTDLNGRQHRPLTAPQARGVAVVFISPDCPIANAFQPALAQLHRRFASKGVAVLLIHSQPGISADAARRHQQEFKIEAPVVLDAEQSLARALHATVTPEAIVLDAHGKVVYRGLIDNLYVGFGRKRRAATEHYLQDAMQALVDQSPIKIAQTRPIGCLIQY